jgi:7,8-dihydropterin-6-yl-methyl-4-(beta-D-ribofuranosyl)aminobenzene 5'-phosphate synthase
METVSTKLRTGSNMLIHPKDRRRRIPLRILAAFAAAIFFTWPAKDACAQNRPQLTVLYDNYPFNNGLIAMNGFSCLIRGTEKTILFDTGERENVLLYNMTTLKINPAAVDIIMISHDHADHTGGLLSILAANKKAKVFLPDGFSDFDLLQRIQAFGARTFLVKQPTQLCKDVFSTGPMQGHGVYEQSLVIKGPSGLTLLCGCAHPGIANIIEKSMTLFQKRVVYVLGGFHLSSASETAISDTIRSFVAFGVAGVGAAHCSNAEMVLSLQAIYGPKYIQMGVGRTIALQ